MLRISDKMVWIWTVSFRILKAISTHFEDFLMFFFIKEKKIRGHLHMI
jgi:hypothetical protein